MATTSSIGTSSRNYSTIAAWLAAFTTGGWIGELYNDSEFVLTSGITFNQSTSATDYIILRCASGQSFRDHASVQSNALRYNQSNGVGITCTTNYVTLFTQSCDYVTFDGLQIHVNNYGGYGLSQTGAFTNNVVRNCIFSTGTTYGKPVGTIRNGLFANCIFSHRNSTGHSQLVATAYATSLTFVNCLVVACSDATVPTNGFTTFSGNTITIKNCAVFGCTNFIGGTSNATGSNNCSDATIGFGSSNQASKTFANQFMVTTSASPDWRMKDNAADLYNNAVTDTTNIPAADDIAKTSRPQSSSWDIGPWELVVGGGGGGGSTARRLALLGVG